MAIVQTEAQVRAMGRTVGIPPERASQIKASGASVTNVAGLRTVVNSLGYYREKADHLVGAGVTFA